MMVFFPECFAFMGGSSDESLAQAEPLTGPLMQRYCSLARCEVYGMDSMLAVDWYYHQHTLVMQLYATSEGSPFPRLLQMLGRLLNA